MDSMLSSFARAYRDAGLAEPAFITNRRAPSAEWCRERLSRRAARLREGRGIELQEWVATEFIPIMGGASTVTITLDTTEPQGASFTIAAGATYATAQAVTCQIATSDGDTTGYQMKIWGNVDPAADADIQATEGASAWITYAATKSITLSTGDGSKTVHCKIKDDVDNVTADLSDSITLDTTAPIIAVQSGPTPQKISEQATKDTSNLVFQSNTALQAWKVKVVPATSSIHSAGTQIPTTAGSTGVTGGSLAATTNQSVDIKGTDLKTAGGADGDKIVKVFGQDLAGNWSVAA